MIRGRQLARVTAASGGTTIWLALLGLFTTPFLLHRLGASAYGVFALITIMSAYLANLELGFGYATVRFLARARSAEDRDAEAEIVGTALFVFLAAAVVASALALVGSTFILDRFAHVPASLRDQTLLAIRLGAVILAFSFLSSLAGNMLQAFGRFDILIAARVVFGTLSSASSVSTVALGGDLPVILGCQLFISCVTTLVLGVAVMRAVGRWIRPALDLETFKRMAGFGFFVLLAGLAYQGLLQGPPTVLASRATTREVAAFSVPGLVLAQLILLMTSTSLSFFSFASGESIQSGRTHLAAVYLSNLRLTLLTMGPIVAFLAVFAHPLLSAWVGAGFADHSAAALRFLSIAALMLSLSAAPVDVSRALGRPSWALVYTAAGAVVAVVLAIVTVSRHGAAGAAASLMVAVVITTPPLVAVVSSRLLGLGMVELGTSFLTPIVAVCALAGVFLLTLRAAPDIEAALGVGVCGSILFAIAAFVLVLRPQEQSALRRAATGNTLALRLRHRAAG